MTAAEDRYWAGSSAEDRAKAEEGTAEARRIAQKRRDMARRLLAPPEPAKAVQEAFQPLLNGAEDRRTRG